MVSRISFDRAALRTRVEQHHDIQIADAQRRLDDALDPTVFAERLSEWRDDAEEAVRGLFARLEDASDIELAKFEVPKPPSAPDHWEINRARDRVAGAKRIRERALAAVDTLFGSNGGGSVELSSAQLRDFFGIEL